MPDEIAYQTLTAQSRANMIRDRLTQLETEHYRLSIAVESPVTGLQNPGDVSRLSELSAQIQRLQQKLAEADA